MSTKPLRAALPVLAVLVVSAVVAVTVAVFVVHSAPPTSGSALPKAVVATPAASTGTGTALASPSPATPAQAGAAAQSHPPERQRWLGPRQAFVVGDSLTVGTR